MPKPSLSFGANEPAGGTVVTEQPFNTLGTTDWGVIWNDAGNATIQDQGSTPSSPTKVIEFRYPSGFAGGAGPAAAVVGLPNLTKAYIGLWWKPSNPWQASTTADIIYYVQTNSDGQLAVAMFGGPGGPYTIRVLPQFSVSSGDWLVPNVNNLSVSLGVWHLIELVLDYSSGTVRWWVDGQAVGDYTGVPFPSGGLIEYKINPTWGSPGETKTEQDFFWFDHAYVGTWSTSVPETPGTVSDLQAGNATSASVTLTFTEVNDGIGSPASYDVRFNRTPISWGSAPSVTQGTCETPVAGISIDNVRSCVVSGLSPSTAYQFQLVAFRGTMNQDAVYGELSNVVTATTEPAEDPGTPGEVDDLDVVGTTGSSVTLSFTEVGDGTNPAQPAKYDVRYSLQPISWGSAQQVTQGTCTTPVAGNTIGNTLTCTVTDLSPGTYEFQLIAFRGTLDQDAVFGELSNIVPATVGTPPPPPGTACVNQPPDVAVTVAEHPFNDFNQPGWGYNDPNNNLTIVDQGQTPKSPTKAVQFIYADTMHGGHGPGTIYHPLPNLQRFYNCLVWKVSANWEYNPIGDNKIQYLQTSHSLSMFMVGSPGTELEFAL